MNESRRNILKGLAATPALAFAPNLLWAQTAGELKISHQFPGGTATEGDFRDRLCRRFSAEIGKRTNGALKGTVYPGSSLPFGPATWRSSPPITATTPPGAEPSIHGSGYLWSAGGGEFVR